MFRTRTATSTVSKFRTFRKCGLMSLTTVRQKSKLLRLFGAAETCCCWHSNERDH